MRDFGIVEGMKAYEVETVVLGTGAAGYNAACLLKKGGEDDLLLVSEARKAGTSRNTGSDKQTYYKLSLAGDDPDSVKALALDLFKGRCVDGDIALCEASLSSASFLRLADMGVPFPVNRYGEYIGYKTDHDPHRRATSAGPYTSRFMTEALEKEAEALNIEMLDGYQAVRILVRDNELRGLILINRKTGDGMVIFCRSLVFATGGPAGIYSMSVYPESQFGATGIAFEAGCMGKNLTEWQYGLASVHPRWNVSGSYMQVIPRFVSIDENGIEHDFLSEYDYKREKMLSLIFLKGYQWPFDVRKLESGSSIIDMLCYLELEKKRRVYLDFMHNPDFKEVPWDKLSEEASSYLKASSATQATPICRLKKLNMPAYEFYLDKGVDLEREYLEISLSAQHNNGGLAIDSWWQSNIKGIFPVGEVAASHGVYRPGGSALNAGQCGSRRASNWILQHRRGGWKADTKGLESQIREICHIMKNASNGTLDAESVYKKVRMLMSLNGAAIRERSLLEKALMEVKEYLDSFEDIQVDSPSKLWILFELRNALISQKVYLASMIDYLAEGGKSRGSALYTDETGSIHIPNLDSRFTYSLEDESIESQIQEVRYESGALIFSRRSPRPIPDEDDFFENVWARYREDKCVY